MNTDLRSTSHAGNLFAMSSGVCSSFPFRNFSISESYIYAQARTSGLKHLSIISLSSFLEKSTCTYGQQPLPISIALKSSLDRFSILNISGVFSSVWVVTLLNSSYVSLVACTPG